MKKEERKKRRKKMEDEFDLDDIYLNEKFNITYSLE